MITVRQMQRQWSTKQYQALFQKLVEYRPEAAMAIPFEENWALPCAAMAVIRLDELAQSETPLCRQLIDVILHAQQADGGWGSLICTALCVRALLCSLGGGVAVERGIGFIASLQQDQGIWPCVPIRRMPEDAFVSAFMLFELGDQLLFRSVVDIPAALKWFDRFGANLATGAANLWAKASTRCRAVSRQTTVTCWSESESRA